MSIREARKKDLEKLSKLYVSIFREPPWNEHWEIAWAQDRLLSIYESPGYYGLVYEEEEGGEIVAGAMGRSLPYQGKLEYELVELFVSTKSQRQGVGNELLTQLESELKHNGHSCCVLLTERGIDAEFFYKKRGYDSTRTVLMALNL